MKHQFSLFVILFVTFASLISESNCLKLKWGIVSAGRIANDFILSLNNYDKADHEVVAIASRNETKAKEYATKFNISTAYNNYLDLAKDQNVNAVYVATINPYHFAAVKLMLENGKHVLCEKPLVIHPEDARELFRIAKEKNLFLLEALWSAFLPAYIQVTELINNGTIGQLEHVSAYQLLTGANLKRLSNINLGGSTALDIGIYSLHAILTAVNFEKPKLFQVAGHKLAENSTDSTVTGIMKFENGVTGSFVMTSATVQISNERLSHVAYIGTKGYIKIPYPMNGPNEYEVNGKTVNVNIMDNQKGYLWLTSAGLRFQAEHMRKQIEMNRITSDKMTPEISYLFADLVKEMHNQMNITFPPTIKDYEFKEL